MSVQNRNSFHLDIFSANPLIESKILRENSKRKQLVIDGKRKRGNFLAPKIFDPSSC